MQKKKLESNLLIDIYDLKIKAGFQKLNKPFECSLISQDSALHVNYSYKIKWRFLDFSGSIQNPNLITKVESGEFSAEKRKVIGLPTIVKGGSGNEETSINEVLIIKPNCIIEGNKTSLRTFKEGSLSITIKIYEKEFNFKTIPFTATGQLQPIDVVTQGD